jgi:hypothetical protein
MDVQEPATTPEAWSQVHDLPVSLTEDHAFDRAP